MGNKPLWTLSLTNYSPGNLNTFLLCWNAENTKIFNSYATSGWRDKPEEKYPNKQWRWQPLSNWYSKNSIINQFRRQHNNNNKRRFYLNFNQNVNKGLHNNSMEYTKYKKKTRGKNFSNIYQITVRTLLLFHKHGYILNILLNILNITSSEMIENNTKERE